jgi:3-hydroxy-3-methylglutaryl CoA synthase/uncharacterized OB-fold protein
VGGIVAYGAYVPYNRLQRSQIGSVLGTGGGRGTRAVASYDEDTTTLGAEAARAALATMPAGLAVERCYFATADPAYLDKTNAVALAIAAGLPSSVLAADMIGSVRSGCAAFQAAVDSPMPAVAVLSDIRTGLPGGADERDGGDAAAAFVFGGDGDDSPVLADVIGGATASEEFLDRWRRPGDRASRVWEERFGEAAYAPPAAAAFTDALKGAGLTADAVDHLIVAGLHGRAVRAFAAASGVRAEARVDDLAATVGNTGTAHAGLMLAAVLDRAGPGEVVAMVVLADGASVVLLRTTPAVTAYRPQHTVSEQLAIGDDTLSYASFLTWRGLLEREPPRRPDPEQPAGPPSRRAERWKFGFVASRCLVCGTRHLPPVRKCVHCGAVDRMEPERMADTTGTVATFTIDRLAYTPSPPLVATVVDFDGGGRFTMELTDVDPGSVAIGDRVEPTFRRIYSVSSGVHNYFWKARPIRPAPDAAPGGVPSGVRGGAPNGMEA